MSGFLSGWGGGAAAIPFALRISLSSTAIARSCRFTNKDQFSFKPRVLRGRWTDDSLFYGAADGVKRLGVLCELLDEVSGGGRAVLRGSMLLQSSLVREYSREVQGGGLESARSAVWTDRLGQTGTRLECGF